MRKITTMMMPFGKTQKLRMQNIQDDIIEI